MAAPEGHGTALGGAALLAALGGVVGPIVAEWALVVFAGSVGVIAAIAEMNTSERTLAGMWWLFVKGLGLSVLFSALLATLASKAIGMTPHEILFPVAGFIAYRQQVVFDMLAKLLPMKKGSR